MKKETKKLKSILLVDDDEIMNFINKKLIASMDVVEQIHTSRHGQEALQFLYQQSAAADSNGGDYPEVIFLDINMPVMDGFEFLEEFQQIPHKHVEIVILTSSDYNRDIQRAKELNVDRIFTKPLTEEKILEVVG